jgi:heat shock protein HslJ
MKMKEKTVKYLKVIIFGWVIISILAGCGLLGRSNSVALPGSAWVLSQINGADVGSEITLVFNDDRLSGNASCNNYFSQYTVEGKELTLGPVGSTLMACPDMDDETTYLEALSDVSRFRVDEQQLVLINSAGKDSLVFVPMPHANLEGTTWNLIGWNTGTALTSLVLNTEMTMELADGELSGSAGCNHYFSTYTLQDDALSFGVVASTEMYCMDPEGVMEQEKGYLQVLSQVRSYEIFGENLTMFDADGTQLLKFVTDAK